MQKLGLDVFQGLALACVLLLRKFIASVHEEARLERGELIPARFLIRMHFYGDSCKLIKLNVAR